MLAVCSACDTIFPFESPESKIKRRKVKQPQNLSLRDTDDKLEMAFRTNFRLDKNESFIGAAFSSTFFTFITFIITNEVLADGKSLLLPLGFALATLALYYWLGLIVYNRTHLEMDDETIRVFRKPLFDIKGVHELSLSGAVVIRCEETLISKKEAYDTPRYRVWAEMADAHQRIIINDVTEDYAYFIAQRLDERLQRNADLDIVHLEDKEQDVEYLADSELISENTASIFQEG
jgi:hypothetical protein